MRRFFVPKDQILESNAVILGQDVNHIKNVLRMNVGDAIALCDGYGYDYHAEISTMDANQVDLVIHECVRNEAEPKTNIILFQGIPKADKMDLIVEKTVELGVYQIVPVYSERCIVKGLDSKKEHKKIQRWQKIAESAAKQSGRGIIPNVAPFAKFNEAINHCSVTHKLILWETEENQSLRQAVEKIKQGDSIAIFIGPEGGLTQTEVALAQEKGWVSVSLGKRILRTETAGLATIASIMYGLEELE